MRVRSDMVVLRDAKDMVGYARANIVDMRCDILLRLNSRSYAQSSAVVGYGDRLYIVPIMNRVGAITMEISTGDNLDVIIVVDDEVVARSTHISYDRASRLYDYYISETHSAEKSGTYIGISEIGTAPTAVDTLDEIDMAGEGELDAVRHDDTARAEDRGTHTPALDSQPFYESIRSELRDLFERYEHESVLEEMLEHSTFARIFYNNEDYYVVGQMTDETGTVRLLCYGYPGVGGDNPPSEVKDSYDWLPIDKKVEGGEGYYMMYQNPVTGDIITN